MKQVISIAKYLASKANNEIIASFHRNKTGKKESLQVRKQDNLFLVEAFSFAVNKWIVVAEHRTEQAAIYDATNWY